MRDNFSDKILIFAGIIIIIAGLKLASNLVAPILFAITLTVLIWPILEWLEKKGVPRFLAITIVAVSVILSMIALIIVITNSLQQLSTNIPYYEEQLDKQLGPLIAQISEWNLPKLMQGAGINGSTLAKAGINFASGFVSSMISVVTFLFMLLLMIVASDSIVRRYKELSGKRVKFATSFESWSKNIQVQYRIQTMSNLISGVITTILFMVLGVDYAVLWGVLAFVLSYIPNVGLIIASIPPVILTFILYGWPTALFAVIFIIALNTVMDNIVTPKFMGAEFKVPAVYIFISFIVCSFIFGILGAFLSLPLFLALRQFLMFDPKTRLLGQLMGASDMKK